MSYRDLRNFTEMLRTLGYPNLVSMESFRNPNFPLTAEILVWLAHRLDPEVDIPLEISNEDERVALIRTAAQFMATKADLKLNTKRLYQADGYAVKELLKITTLLYEAISINSNKTEEIEEDSPFTFRDFDISDKINDIKQSRQLASEITTNGATLYDLLGREVDLRSLRHISVGRQFEINEVETEVKKAIEAVRKEIDDTQQLISNVAASEASLDSKIERRKIELDRYEKRLQALKKVKPAFLEEFTRLENELKELYEQYVTKFRCLTYLELKVAEVESAETERMQQQLAATRRLVEQMRQDESETTITETDEIEREAEEVKKHERPRPKTGGRGRTVRPGQQINISQDLKETPETSTESDTEDLLLDGEEPELAGSVLGSDDDSLGLELSGMDTRVLSGRKTVSKTRQDNSDDDF